MTKSVLIALVLTSLALVILRLWFFDRPATDRASFEAAHEQSQVTVENPDGSSPQWALNVAVESPAKNSDSPATLKGSSSRQAVSASRSAESARLQQSASALLDDEQPEELAIAGLVQDEEGYPLANVEVLAKPLHSPDTDNLSGDPSLEAVRSASTNYEGFFVFSDLADGEYRIRVAPIDGFATAETTARVGVLDVNLVLVQLWDVRFYGTVNNTEGTPLEDVRVFGGTPPHSTYSGSEGDYELDVSIKGKKQPSVIRFRHDGYRDQTIQLAPAELEDLFDFPLDIVMEPLKGLTTVTGRLEDPDGRPVGGKVLSLRSSRLNSSYSTHSDARGDFSMENVEPGKDYKIAVRPGGDFRDFETAQLEIPDSGLKLKVVLEPLNNGELSGWMTNVDGKPIPGFAMTLHSNAVTGRSVQVVGDHQGFFTVNDFPEGSVVLKTNSYPVLEVQGIRVSNEPEEPASVVLDMGPHVLLGQVTTVFGDTVAASEVSLGWQHSENGVQNYSARKTAADQNGSFEFTGLGPGVHTLRVNAPGFKMGVVKVDVSTDPNNIVVELEEES